MQMANILRYLKLYGWGIGLAVGVCWLGWTNYKIYRLEMDLNKRWSALISCEKDAFFFAEHLNKNITSVEGQLQKVYDAVSVFRDAANLDGLYRQKVAYWKKAAEDPTALGSAEPVTSFVFEESAE